MSKIKTRKTTKKVELLDENPTLNKKEERSIKGKKKVIIKVTEYGRSHTKAVHLSESEISKLKQ